MRSDAVPGLPKQGVNYNQDDQDGQRTYSKTLVGLEQTQVDGKGFGVLDLVVGV